jgi:hypothetical protein
MSILILQTILNKRHDASSSGDAESLVFSVLGCCPKFSQVFNHFEKIFSDEHVLMQLFVSIGEPWPPNR